MINLQRNAKDYKYLAKKFDETVYNAVKPFMEDNTNFTLSEDEVEMYGIIVLDVDTVGGFNKDTKKDEAKGTFIEQVKKGTYIKTYNAKELISNGYLGFIPNEETIKTMGEYGFLRSASYEIALVDEDGTVLPMEVEPLPFTKIEEMVLNNVNINEILSGDETEEEADTNVIEELETPENDDDMEFNTDLESEEESGDDEVYENDVQLEEEKLEPSTADIHDLFKSQKGELAQDEPNMEENETYVDSNLTEYDENQAENYEENVEISKEDVEDTYIRFFETSEIPLSYDLSNFDKHFPDEGIQLLPTDTDESPLNPRGFTNKYLNERAKFYNSKLIELHEANRAKLKGQFSQYLGLAAQSVMKEFSLDGDGETAREYSRLQEFKSTSNDSVYEETQRKIEEATVKYNEEKEAAMERARVEAGFKYDNMNKAAFNRRMENMRQQLEDKNANDYNEMYAEFHENRVRKAIGSFNDKQISVIDRIMADYKSAVGRENKLREEFEKEMKQFELENMKSSIAAYEVEKDKLNIEDVEAKYEERARLLEEHKATEIAAKKMEIEERFNAINEDLQRKVKDLEDSKKAYAEREKEREEAHKKALDARIAEEKAKYDLDIKKLEYDIKKAEGNANDWKNRSSEMSKLQRYTYNTVVAIAAVGIIAACCIGYLKGMNTASHEAKEKTQSYIVEQLDKKLDKVKEDLDKSQNDKKDTNNDKNTNENTQNDKKSSKR